MTCASLSYEPHPGHPGSGPYYVSPNTGSGAPPHFSPTCIPMSSKQEVCFPQMPVPRLDATSRDKRGQALPPATRVKNLNLLRGVSWEEI